MATLFLQTTHIRIKKVRPTTTGPTRYRTNNIYSQTKANDGKPNLKPNFQSWYRRPLHVPIQVLGCRVPADIPMLQWSLYTISSQSCYLEGPLCHHWGAATHPHRKLLYQYETEPEPSPSELSGFRCKTTQKKHTVNTFLKKMWRVSNFFWKHWKTMKRKRIIITVHHTRHDNKTHPNTGFHNFYFFSFFSFFQKQSRPAEERDSPTKPSPAFDRLGWYPRTGIRTNNCLSNLNVELHWRQRQTRLSERGWPERYLRSVDERPRGRHRQARPLPWSWQAPPGRSPQNRHVEWWRARQGYRRLCRERFSGLALPSRRERRTRQGHEGWRFCYDRHLRLVYRHEHHAWRGAVRHLMRVYVAAHRQTTLPRSRNSRSLNLQNPYARHKAGAWVKMTSIP